MQTWLVDTNVLINVLQADAAFGPSSLAVLERIAADGVLVINPVVYAEVAAWIESKERLDVLLPVDLFRRESLPIETAFLAGRASGATKPASRACSRIS